MNHDIFFSLYNLAHQSIFTDWVIVFSTSLFGKMMIVLAIIFLVFHTDGVFDYKKPFLQLKNKILEMTLVLFSILIPWGISAVIKYVVASPRPFLVFEEIKPLFLHGGFDSFPSGHATFFSALAVSLFLRHKRIGIIYIVVALIVSLARVASGVHFPIDILAGWIIGSTGAFVLYKIFNKKNI